MFQYWVSLHQALFSGLLWINWLHGYYLYNLFHLDARYVSSMCSHLRLDGWELLKITSRGLQVCVHWPKRVIINQNIHISHTHSYIRIKVRHFSFFDQMSPKCKQFPAIQSKCSQSLALHTESSGLLQCRFDPCVTSPNNNHFPKASRDHKLDTNAVD